MRTMWRWVRIASGIAVRGVGDTTLRKAVAGKVVLVTGASEGIGAATARRLGRAGAIVLLVARTAARLETVRREIAEDGGIAHVYPADLSRPDEAEALGLRILDDHRRVDVIVNNAGRSIRRSVADTSDRFHDVQRTIDLNYLGPVQLLLVLLPAMRAAGRGHLVNVSTAGILTPAPQWSSYLASKAAFDVWLRSAAPELRRDGVTTSTFYCGLVRTRMSAPTKAYRDAPAMTPDEAAAVVCRAVARRPRTIEAWWMRPSELFAAAFKGTVERSLSGDNALDTLRAAIASGLLRPSRLLRLLRATRRYGWTLAAAVEAGPADGIALVDDHGSITREQLRLDMRGRAAYLRDMGVTAGDRIGIRCGNDRGLVTTAAAAGLLGADAVLLPPTLDDDELTAVTAREGLRLTVGDGPTAAPTWLPRPRRPGRLTVLTSGTTGPRQAVRRPITWRVLLGPAVTHLRLIPLRPGTPIAVAAPAYHGYGLSYLAAGLALGAPVVLATGLRPHRLREIVDTHRPTALFALPVQLGRLADLPEADALHGRTRLVTGSEPLDPELCLRLLDVFGDRLFNLFGATEAGWATIATPADLRAAPGTVGRPPRGVRIRVLDGDGRDAPPGEAGAVHVSGWLPGGALVATGDVGYLDRAGRLMLTARVPAPSPR
ncbi:MAG: SDR family NAD(P)-dependent oxidoreductase [Hamadaea sp.]|nr:SDR family NAD(P)-dependent oxidoreductase [Hamadaea sp.]